MKLASMALFMESLDFLRLKDSQSASRAASKDAWACNQQMTSHLDWKEENECQCQETVMNYGTWQQSLMLLLSLLLSLTTNGTNQSKKEALCYVSRARIFRW